MGSITYRGGWHVNVENGRLVTGITDIFNVSQGGFNMLIETHQPYSRIFADALDNSHAAGFGSRLDILSTRDTQYLRQLCAVYNQPYANTPLLRQTLRNLP